MELGRVLLEATASLSRLDAGALEELTRRALALQASLQGQSVRAAEASALRARHQVFSDVVTVMSRDLAMLHRTCAQEHAQYRAEYQPEAGVRWAR